MKLWVLIAVSSATALFAQSPTPQRLKNVIGEVVSADAAGNKLQMKTDTGQTYSVTTDGKTSFLRVPPGEKDLSKATPIALKDISTGDRVMARGPIDEEAKIIPATRIIVMTKTDLAQKHERDRAEWARRGVAGTVTAIDPADKKITVSIGGAAAKKTVTVDASGTVDYRRYAPDSVRFSDAKPSSFAELKPGDSLRVLGEKNPDGSEIKAEDVVSGSFRTLAVQIISVDAANNTIKATDLQTKQPIVIHVNSDATLKRMPERMAMFMAQSLNAGGAGAAGGAGGPGASGRGPGMQGGDAGGPRPEGNAMRPRPEGAGGPGGPRGPGTPGGGPGGGRFAGGPGGPMGRGNFDFQQMLERLPTFTLAELKPGDALIISSTNGADRASATAITMVAGVEPFLAAAPRSAGAVNLGAWSFDIGMPAQ